MLARRLKEKMTLASEHLDALTKIVGHIDLQPQAEIKE